jgi:hypothetical protein
MVGGRVVGGGWSGANSVICVTCSKILSFYGCVEESLGVVGLKGTTKNLKIII